MLSFYVHAPFGWPLIVVSLLTLSACHRTGQDPQPVRLPAITLSRTFEHTSTQPVKVVYAPDSLRYSVARTRNGLTLNVELNRQRTGKDIVSVELDSAILRPGLTGNYAVPLVDTTAQVLPPSLIWVDYTYYRSVNAGNISILTLNRGRFLPGSYLTLTEYDPARQTLSGRFSFRFTMPDPFASNGVTNWDDENWIATVASEFSNLPITR